MISVLFTVNRNVEKNYKHACIPSKKSKKEILAIFFFYVYSGIENKY